MSCPHCGLVTKWAKSYSFEKHTDSWERRSIDKKKERNLDMVCLIMINAGEKVTETRAEDEECLQGGSAGRVAILIREIGKKKKITEIGGLHRGGHIYLFI